MGPVDDVLVSHDLHPDNLDDRGRAFTLAAPLLVTGPRSASRLGPPSTPLRVWETATLPRGDRAGDLTIRAVPAMHGPADGVPTVYISGDNASIAVLVEVARRVGPIDVAVLFVGAARVPTKERGRPLTLTSERATAAAAVLGAPLVVPAHWTAGPTSAKDPTASSRPSTTPGCRRCCEWQPRAGGWFPPLPDRRPTQAMGRPT